MHRRPSPPSWAARAAAAAVTAASALAVAQPAPSETPAPDRADGPIAPAPVRAPAAVPEPDWERAPRPDQASGVARGEPHPVHERLKWIPRAILFVPRWAFFGIAQPARYAAYASEQYNIPNRVRRLLLSDDETYGVYPVATYESEFGLDAGARFFHDDVFGARERLRLRANFGGRFRQAYGITVGTGDRLGRRLALELDVSYARRPIERFYGIGDTFVVPLREDRFVPTSDLAVATRFREDLVRAVAKADTPIAGALGLRTSGAFASRAFASTGDEDSLELAYDTTRLPGWSSGVDNLYVEAELFYDTRRPASRYQTRALDGTGWLAAAHVGRAFGIGDGATSFGRYGAEVQRYIDLYDGSRILALRALVEGVTDEATFIDLPRLGGPEFLRGYPSGRFRDRTITLATAEYTWDLGNFMAAYAFVDAGRVWPTLADVRLDETLRVGYGGGVQVHTSASFLARLQIAASRDGDVLFQLALTPAFGRRARTGRY